MGSNADRSFQCYQTKELCHVVHTDGGAVVSISRAVGNREARALMRLCAAVLNGNFLEAAAEFGGIAEDAALRGETT